ncbi:acetyltransferase, GNAT family protein [Enhygromyxa salina]|uniref:Acetyltransferase, GNAT family protein n=1 Tax=Enhygromyxa salina TaxID=215803 RepID=A0A0C2CLI8_9BACT|nr:GNAT family N-acetyltransferase [Enhygromyxa salina]KIG12106.1 acetyltransferase, GNAT family protein [Enhygromyxa salina]
MSDAPTPSFERLPGEQLPTLECTRVRLRRLNHDDAADVFRVFSDPEVMRYWSSLPIQTPEQASALIEQTHACFAEHTLYQWGIERRSDSRVIGTVTLASLDAANRRAEIGFALARDTWGAGYMIEAARAVISLAFETMGLERIEADVDPRNAASLVLLAKLDFVREGLLRERWRVGTEVADSVMLGLLRREWAGRPA